MNPRIPAAIGWPLHRAVLSIATERDDGTRGRADAEDKIDAVVIPCVLALILFMLFTIPLFIRKYMVRLFHSHGYKVFRSITTFAIAPGTHDP